MIKTVINTNRVTPAVRRGAGVWQSGSTIKQTIERGAVDVDADLVDHGTGMVRGLNPTDVPLCGRREMGRVAAQHRSAIRFHLGLARKRVVWIGDMELLSVKRALADLWAVRSSLSGALPNAITSSSTSYLGRSPIIDHWGLCFCFRTCLSVDQPLDQCSLPR